MSDLTVKLCRLHPDAELPSRGSPQAAGWDITSTISVTIPQGDCRLVDTGWAVELPEGWECQVRSRSGLAGKGITVANSPGTVDADYRGEISVLLHNASNRPYLLKKGDRIAQLVFARVPTVTLEVVSALSRTSRGANGFGSTGD